MNPPPLILVSCAALIAAPNAWAGSAEFCQKYAENAVAQYTLMTSHPQCKVPDDLRWQGSYDNHYKGCQMAPEFILRSEEAARQKHLDQCGGNAPIADVATPAASAETVAASAAATQTAAAGTKAGTDVAATAGNTANAKVQQHMNLTLGQCQPFNNDDLPEKYFANNKVVGKAKLLSLDGNQAVVQDYSNGQTYEKFTGTYQIARPHFFTVKCHGFPPDSGAGIWVATRAGGAPRLLNIAGFVNNGYSAGEVQWWEIPPQFAQQLLQGGAATAPASATAAAKPTAKPSTAAAPVTKAPTVK